MSKQQVKYEIKIERKKRGFLEAKYDWEVNTYLVTEEKNWQGIVEQVDMMDYSMSDRDRAYTIARAKKKAIKQILSVEKDIDQGIQFGAIIFVDKTNAKDAIEQLK